MTISLPTHDLKNRIIPQRARERDWHELKTPRLFNKWLGQNPEPSLQQWLELATDLQEGDPLMDALLDWISEKDSAVRKKQFHQALEHGIDSIEDAPATLRDFFHVIEQTPDWLDWQKIEEGILFTHRCGLAMNYILRDVALMGGYLLSGFNHSLILTGALNKSASQRMAETGKWWIDCTEVNGLQRFGPGFKTTIHVRMVHGLVRRHLVHHPEWHGEQNGLPISQTDMMATYLAFAPLALFAVRLMGIPVSSQESEAVMHLWKYIAWLMGVDSKWLVDDEKAGLVQLYQSVYTQSKPNESSRILGSALANEPFERQIAELANYPLLHKYALKLHYEIHLSISSLFLNLSQREQLGLPTNRLPWFPLLTAGPRFLNHHYHLRSAERKQKLAKQGREQQVALLNAMFGKREQRITQLAQA